MGFFFFYAPDAESGSGGGYDQGNSMKTGGKGGATYLYHFDIGVFDEIFAFCKGSIPDYEICIF